MTLSLMKQEACQSIIKKYRKRVNFEVYPIFQRQEGARQMSTMVEVLLTLFGLREFVVKVLQLFSLYFG